MSSIIRAIKYTLWQLRSFLPMPIGWGCPQKLTVFITYYNPVRMRHIEPHVRSLLQCRFVEQIVLSNHNPEIRIEEQIRLRDPRLLFLNQSVRRGCGYRWLVAHALKPSYLIVVDDDVLLYPAQLAQLFTALVAAPEVPHGFTGLRVCGLEHFEYHEQAEATVDYLCEIYGVTRQHLQRYLELRNNLAADPDLLDRIDTAVDFMLISQSGCGEPQIHNAGRLLRCESFKSAEIAVHKRVGFAESMVQARRALQAEAHV